MKIKYAFAGIFLLLSCGTTSDKENTVAVKELFSEIIAEDSLLRRPSGLCVADSCLLISNLKADTIIDVFDFAGNRLNSFLRKGDGPSEGLFVVHLQYDPRNGCVYAPDLHKKSLLCFSDVSGTPRVETVFKYLCEPNDSVYLHNWYGRLSDNRILSGNSSKGGMLALFSEKGDFIDFYEDVPDKKEVDEKLNDWANSFLYTPMGAVAPDGNKVAIVYDNADILVIAELLKNGELKTKSLKTSLPNDIAVVQYGEQIVQAAITMKTIIHYQSIAATDKYIYALYIGKPYGDIHRKGYKSSMVKVFDWNGNLCMEYKLDSQVKNIAVTADGELLFAICESESGYALLKYAL